MEKRFVIDQKQLLNLLASMQPICSKRITQLVDTTATILFQVGYKELVLKSTDLEISLQASCLLHESSLTEPEIFLVPGKRVFEVVKGLDGLITCSIKNNQLVLEAGAVTLTLNIMDAHEFPPFPERIENLMHLEAAPFLKILDSVAFLIPQNNTTRALNGLFLEISPQQLTMTTSDGDCLAHAKSPRYTLASSKTWLLPRRAIFELKKILETYQDQAIFLGTCSNQLVFSGELFNFFTKLLADPFPQYQALLDKTSFAPATVERSRLIKTLRRSSSLLLQNQHLATKFSFASDKLRVSLYNKEVGTLDEELPIAGTLQEQLDIRFYAPYLLNGLQAFTQDELTFYIHNSTKPIIFESENTDMHLMYLVMPLVPLNT